MVPFLVPAAVFYCEIVCGIVTIYVEDASFSNAEMIKLWLMVRLASKPLWYRQGYGPTV